MNISLRNIGMVREYMSQDIVERLIHAFVSSNLDFMNCLFFGAPNIHLDKLLRVQNAVVRPLTETNMREKITTVLMKLHWLPVKQHVDYTILLFVYRAFILHLNISVM